MSCDSGAGAECDGDVAVEAEASVQLSLKQQLNLAIQRSMSDEVQPTVSPNIVKSTTAAIRTEFTIFQTTGVRGRCLQLAYSYLLSVPPASVEAERAFSAAGLLCTKIRSRMSDKSLDALCFLRSYYATSMRKVDDK